MFSVFIVKGKQNKFIVSGSPDSNNITSYKDHILKHDVTCIVRLCEPLYDETVFTENGVVVVDMYLDDGNIPTHEQLCRWTEITKEHKNISVHCVAGLGRSPTLVCFTLIVNDGKDPYDAIGNVRSVIKHSLNRRQVNFLMNVKRPKYNTKYKPCECVIC